MADTTIRDSDASNIGGMRSGAQLKYRHFVYSVINIGYARYAPVRPGPGMSCSQFTFPAKNVSNVSPSVREPGYLNSLQSYIVRVPRLHHYITTPETSPPNIPPTPLPDQNGRRSCCRPVPLCCFVGIFGNRLRSLPCFSFCWWTLMAVMLHLRVTLIINFVFQSSYSKLTCLVVIFSSQLSRFWLE